MRKRSRYEIELYGCIKGSEGTVVGKKVRVDPLPPDIDYEHAVEIAEKMVDGEKYCGYSIAKVVELIP